MKINEKFYDNEKRVKCIDDVFRRYENCIAYCNNKCHKGFITKELLEKHKCIEKNCTFMDPMENHPYWLAVKAKKEKKVEIRLQNKKWKEKEKIILEKAKEISPEYVEVVMCKHLYDSTYVLIALKSDFSIKFSKSFFKKHKIHVYVKTIEKHQCRNIEYTYKSLLPENMKERLKK